MHGNESAAYRAVITTTYPAIPDSDAPSFMQQERKSTKVAGPYSTIGAARAAITRARNDAASWTPGYYIRRSVLRATVDGYVERSATVWERVPDER